MEETPHIFFAGNQPEYASRLVHGNLSLDPSQADDHEGLDGQKVRIVSIPKFSETGEIVLINLSTLESEVVRFSSGTIRGKDEEEAVGNGDTVMDDIEEL